MTRDEFAEHAAGIAKQLPESALTARIALSLMLSNYATVSDELDDLREFRYVTSAALGMIPVKTSVPASPPRLSLVPKVGA